MPLSEIIEKKNDEFAFFLDGMVFSNEDIEVILPQVEKAIRESVEEALREVVPKRKGWVDDTRRMAYNDCISQVKLLVKEFMK